MGGHQKAWKLYEQRDLIDLAAASWPHSPTIIIMDCLTPIKHFKTKAFIKFLSNVKYAYTRNIRKRKGFIICWNNAAIHKNNEVKRFCQDEDIPVLFITSYLPWLNQIEGFIGCIKSKLLSSKREGR